MQTCVVGLRDRRRREGFRVELGERVRRIGAEFLAQQGEHGFGGRRRHAILQPAELLDERRRQQVGAGGEQLAELRERHAALFQRAAQRPRELGVAAGSEPGLAAPGEVPAEAVADRDARDPPVVPGPRDAGARRTQLCEQREPGPDGAAGSATNRNSSVAASAHPAGGTSSPTAARALVSAVSGKVRTTRPPTPQPKTPAHSARTYPTRTPSTRSDAVTSGHSART
ncbi:hypothetical protein AB0K15_09995 [Amycolatopsis sp. NPDC049253]|uniref:hypothetical protein n=1 Tax=Amycolatopsis sp. NPDC049253 TaxID=3155274 RepID=UPI00343A698E